MNLLAALTRNERAATIMVTHDEAQLAAADHVYEMADGRLAPRQRSVR